MVQGVIQVLYRRGHDLAFHSAPDLKGTRPNRTGKLVDFILADIAAGGALWNVEVKQLVPRHVREQHEFVRSKLAALDGHLPGTYVAELHIDIADPASRINTMALDAVLKDVLADAAGNGVRALYDAVPECILRRVRDDNSLAVPWIWDYELDLAGPRTTAVLDLLRRDFARQLANSRIKFQHSAADRNLLLFETRSTPLDDMFHLWSSADGPGVVSRWMDAVACDWTAKDMIIVDPHVWVGQLDPPTGRHRLVLTGHVYADDTPYTPLGRPWRLWPPPEGFA